MSKKNKKKIVLQEFDNGAKLVLKLPKNKKDGNKKKINKRNGRKIPYEELRTSFRGPINQPYGGRLGYCNPVFPYNDLSNSSDKLYTNLFDDIKDRNRKAMEETQRILSSKCRMNLDNINNESESDDTKTEIFDSKKELEKGNIKPVEGYKDEFKEVKDDEESDNTSSSENESSTDKETLPPINSYLVAFTLIEEALERYKKQLFIDDSIKDEVGKREIDTIKDIVNRTHVSDN